MFPIPRNAARNLSLLTATLLFVCTLQGQERSPSAAARTAESAPRFTDVSLYLSALQDDAAFGTTPLVVEPLTRPSKYSDRRPLRSRGLVPLQLVRGDPVADSSDDPIDDEPNVAEPGPDMGDYPNSAYTLKKGRVQLEIGPLSFRTKNSQNPSAYATPFLFRYGVTDDVEFRLLGTGFTELIQPTQTTGFGVLTFDTKIHLWDDRMEYYIPAVSFEAAIQSQIGSSAFQAGNEPSLNINMDFPFTEATNFEMTVGYSGNLTTVNLVSHNIRTPTTISTSENLYVWSLQAAIEQEVTEKLTLFVHGYYSAPVGNGGDVGLVTGAGFFYQLSQRLMTFGSANAGLADGAAPFLSQLGIAYAF